ncbi:hypothetical protein PG985_016249 [Apiospora marii]|uniref:uncharacterized protein n=1 Tax=Apiospora marii TaxID=335849 RepID=UPI0031316D15
MNRRGETRPTAKTSTRSSNEVNGSDGRPAAAAPASRGSCETTSGFPALYFLDPENSVPRLPSSSTVCPQRAAPDPLLDGLWSSLDEEVPGLDAAVARYFATVHCWLPILSKKQLYRTLAQQQQPAQRTDTNFALLLTCMRLLTTRPSSPGHQQEPAAAATCPRYLSAKEGLTKAETRCLPSLALLQATILVAAHELAHGIYPAAYLSAGHAARLGIMMGFHDREHGPQMFQSPVTWTGREEERRAWWAVVILDRLAHQGIHGLPLAAPEPHPGELLPAPDESWDLGAIGVNEALFVMASSTSSRSAASNPTEASSMTINTGSFANLCQSAHLLGLVLRHREELGRRQPQLPQLQQQQQPMVANGTVASAGTTGISDGEIGFHIREARQLHHATSAFTRHLCSRSNSSSQAVPVDPGVLGTGVASAAAAPVAVSAAMAVTFSARVILCGLYACNERWEGCTRSAEETELQQLALGGIYEVAREVAGLARRQLQLILTTSADGLQLHQDEEEEGEEDDGEVRCNLSPLICHCLYQVAGECEWLVLEDENCEADAWIQDVVELLAIMAQRWQVAGAYLADITSWPSYKQVLNARLEGMDIAAQ